MAYCKQCGAYIPDGQDVCLACGFDEKAAARAEKKSSGSKAAYSFQNDELREKLERQRAQQQERSRQWAEQEKERREKQQASRQWAEEEYQRRQAEKEQQAESYVNRSTSTDGSTASQPNQVLAALSYLSFLFILPRIFAPEDRYARFHAKQGLKLFVFGIVADIAASFIGLGWIVSLARFYLIYKGMNNALNGSTEPLPWIGNIGDDGASGL